MFKLQVELLHYYQDCSETQDRWYQGALSWAP